MAFATIAAGASRPFLGETANGDRWRVDREAQLTRVILIDALGHGPAAAEIAAIALAAVPETFVGDPSETIEAFHDALKRTRGAAIGVAVIDAEQQLLSFVGVGNVELRVLISGRERRFASARGIVGFVLPTLRVETVSLPEQWLALLHSDGVGSKFALPGLIDEDIAFTDMPKVIVERWGRTTDDATVVVVAPAT